MFIDAFNDLLADNELNRKQFAEKSGIPYTTVIGWTKQNRLPDYNALIKIADFFHCSTDFLTGRQEDYGKSYHSVNYNPREHSLLNNFRRLDNESKFLIEKLTDKLADK